MLREAIAPSNVPANGRQDSFGSAPRDRRDPIRALDYGLSTNSRGFTVVGFKYHEGFSVSTDERDMIIAFSHCHPHFEIFCVRKGEGILALDCDLVEVRPGSIVIVKPGDIHVWQKTVNLEGTLISVTEALANASNLPIPFSGSPSMPGINTSRSFQLCAGDEALIQGFIQALESPENESSFERGEVLKALLLMLFGNLRSSNSGLPAAAPGGRASILTRRFEQALITECPRLSTVKEFAEHLNVSRSYLHRWVERDRGRPPGDLIRERTIFESKRLLLHTSKTPSQIAEYLGFGSAAYFSSFFRRHTALSPRAFRTQATP